MSKSAAANAISETGTEVVSEWSAKNTTPNEIDQALRELLGERYKNGAFVPARVMNLIVIVEAGRRDEIEERLRQVGAYHPSRLLLASVDKKRDAIDARAIVSSDDGIAKPGHIVVGRERVVLELGPEQAKHLDAIVEPLLVTDLTTMVWSPHGQNSAVDAIRAAANIILVDSQEAALPRDGFDRALELTKWAYVVDLAWLRTTPWRERIAATFDPPSLRPGLAEIERVVVRHRQDSGAAALLLCGWLATRMGWEPQSSQSLQRGATCVTGAGKEVALEFEAVELASPGLGGVTVELGDRTSFSLDRGPGGLRAVRRAANGRKMAWTVMGASRGEAGILGEGVRQALLRDHTYKPALQVGRALVAAEPS